MSTVRAEGHRSEEDIKIEEGGLNGKLQRKLSFSSAGFFSERMSNYEDFIE